MRRIAVTGLVLAAVTTIAAAEAPRDAEPAPPDPDGLTTSEWRRPATFDLHWRLLMLPESILELAFVPVALLVGVTEEYRLDRRVTDLLELGPFKISPRFKFSFGDGVGAGAKVTLRELDNHRAAVAAGGVYRINGDWELELDYEHHMLLPGGRGLRARAFMERDVNEPYYGLGGFTTTADRRVVTSNDQGAAVEIDIQGIDRYTYSGIAEIGVRRQELSPGVDAGRIPVGGMDDTVMPPPGFGDTAVFTDLRLVGRFDTRDTIGRPTRGWAVEVGGLARTDVTGANLSALTLGGNAHLHLPVLPDGRVLVLSFGGAAALPLFPGDEIPLDSLAVLGRTHFLRGYDRVRFRDRYAVHGSVEYRFPVYEYLASRAGLDSFMFLDVGTVFGKEPFSLDPLRYSVGTGLRAAHETTLVFEGTVGWSPEGFQLNLGVEKTL